MTNAVKRVLTEFFQDEFATFLDGQLPLRLALKVLEAADAGVIPSTLPDEDFEKLEAFMKVRQKATASNEAENDDGDDKRAATVSTTKLLLNVSHHGPTAFVIDQAVRYQDLPVTRMTGPSLVENAAVSGSFSVSEKDNVVLLDFGTLLRLVYNANDLLLFKP